MPKSTSPFRFLSGLGRKNLQDVERKNNEAARKWQLRLDNFITREKGLEESIKHISNDKETLTQQLSSDFSRAANVKQYLIPFVDEFYVIASQDFVLKNSEIFIKIGAILCDRVARSLVKFIIHHNGKKACERYTVKEKSRNRRTFFY